MNQIKIEELTDLDRVEFVLNENGITGYGRGDTIITWQGTELRVGDTFTWEENEHGGITFEVLSQ